MMVKMGLNRLVGNLKSKVMKNLKNMKGKGGGGGGSSSSSSYDKIEKSESMRVELRSRKARKLIEKTLKLADSPRTAPSHAL